MKLDHPLNFEVLTKLLIELIEDLVPWIDIDRGFNMIVDNPTW